MLPKLAELQRQGMVTTEKVQMWSGPCTNCPAQVWTQKLCRPQNNCSPTTRRCSVPPICTATPLESWMQPIRTAQNPSMNNCSKTGAIWS